MLALLAVMLTNRMAAADNAYLQASLYQQIDARSDYRLLSQREGISGSSGTNDLSSGVLYLLTDNNDLSAFISFNPAFVKFAVVLSYNLFNPTVLDQLGGKSKVAGVLVVQEHSAFPNVSSYSPFPVFPNFEYSLYANLSDPPHSWNPNGNDLLRKSYDFPIFILGRLPDDKLWSQSIGTLMQAVTLNRNNSYINYPLYAVQFDSFMWGAFDVVTCLRRGFCSAVGGNSLWATSAFNFSATDNRVIIVVSAAMDARTFFLDNAWGIESTTTGYVTLLAVAEALSRARIPMSQLPKTLLWTLFQAEQFGFSGSQRFVKDITTPFTCALQTTEQTGGCPFTGFACSQPCLASTNFTQIDFNKIAAIIEFNQVGGIGLENPSNAKIFLHVDDPKDASTQALLVNFTGSVTVNVSTPDSIVRSTVTLTPASSDGINRRLPPSSAMSFLSRKKIPAIVMGDYQDSFTNRFYGAEQDDDRLWNSSHVGVMCGLATLSARSIYTFMGGDGGVSGAQLEANCTLVAEMMACFSRNLSCPLFRQYYTAPILTSSQYAGTYSLGSSVNYIPFFINLLLANYTATNWTKVECSRTNDSCAVRFDPSFSCLAGQCVQTTLQIHPAYGVGLDFDAVSGSPFVRDPARNTFVQSLYSKPGRRIRVFLTTSAQYDGMILGVGVAVTIATVGIYLVVQHLISKHIKVD